MMAYVSCRTCKYSYVFDGVNGSVHHACSMTYEIDCIGREYFFYKEKEKEIKLPVDDFISKDEMII
jgi:hypothetical protein